MGNQGRKTSETIAVLWTNAQPAVAAFVSSIVPNFQDADDILQQVAVAVVKNYDKYDTDRPFVAWAIGIAKNEVLMYRRKNAGSKVIFSEQAIQAIAEVHEEESHKFNDMKHALDSCIDKLKERAKLMLKMRYVSELSVSRIAQKLGMTQNAVYTTFHRIHVALRECINRRLISSGGAD